MNNSLNKKLNLFANLNDSRSFSSLNHSLPSSDKKKDENKKRRAVISTSVSSSSSNRSGYATPKNISLDTNNLNYLSGNDSSQRGGVRIVPLSPSLADKESNELLRSKSNSNLSRSLKDYAPGKKVLKLTEKDWKERWLQKFNNLIDSGMYSPDSSDKLLFTYLNEKKQYLKSKYTFNEYLAGSQERKYNFNPHSKKIDLNYLYKIFKSFFKTLESLISFPYLEVYPDKVKIRLFYYVLPSITKKIIHQSLHRYIRSDEKLYKELILRRKFQSIMEKFKMKLFIAKWKEDNYLVSSPSPLSFFKGFDLKQIYGSELDIKSFKTLSMTPINNYSASTSEKGSPLNLIVLSSVSDKHGAGGAIARVRIENNSDDSKTSLDLSKLNTLDYLKSSKASDVNNKDTRAILKNKSMEDFESVVVKNSTAPLIIPQQISGSAYAAAAEIIKSKGPVHASLTKLKDRKVSTLVSLNKKKFKYLIYILEKLFKKTIILELVKLKYPYHESNILAQVLGLSSKNKSFRKLMIKLLYTANISNPTNKVIKKNLSIIPSYLSGLKVKLAGRLITQRVVPRFTVQSFQIGSLARGKINFMNSSRITLKNKRGAFSFTVTTSHIFEK